MGPAMPVPAYDVHGSGPPLVLLHSAGMAAQEWDKHVDRLGESFRLLVPDLPGHGRTPPPEGEPGFGVLAEAVEAMLDEEGVDGANLVGSSMGGGVAQRLMAEAPDRLQRVVLFRCTYRRTDAVREASRMMGDPSYWESHRMDTWLSRVHEPRGGPEAWKEVLDWVTGWLSSEEASHGAGLEDLEAYRDPVLLAVGDRDPVAPLEEVMAMHEALPDSALWVLPDADHAPATNTWRRGIFDAEVRRFLGASPGRPTD